LHYVTGVGGNEWLEMRGPLCGCICIRRLFARLLTDADATLHVAADASGRTWTRRSNVISCVMHVMRVLDESRLVP